MAAWKSATGKESYQFVNRRSAEGQVRRTSLQVAKQCLRMLLFVVVAVAMGTIAIKITDGFGVPTQTL
jgi:hypothetical protein